MLRYLRSLLQSRQGFTLVELMTVLIILGVIMGIGVPKYLRIQSQAEYDADVTTIENIAKAAEIYAVQKGVTGNINLKTVLIDKGIVDGNIELNRKKNSTGTSSVKNTDNTKLSTYTSVNFNINADGKVSNLKGAGGVFQLLIGDTVY